MTILSIGEILWDVYPDSSRLGGAPFNFAVNAHRLGHRVLFLSAVGDDERGAAAREKAAALGLDTSFIQTAAGAPTGHVTVCLDAAGQPDYTIHRPAAYDFLRLSEAELTRLAALEPDWIYFGTLYQMDAGARREVRSLMEALPGARRFYDVNLRRASYTPELVRESIALANVIKLNEEEAELFPDFGGVWAAAVTRGERGCKIRIGDDRAECPASPVKVADAVGAGDAFAAAFLHGISQGWSAARIGSYANRLGGLVASRAGAIPDWSAAELE
ncbi:MAG: PfkB domain protein [Candidatus Solibacter sp.]|jgi:fructokinase|nr:PfkB domain protein [Candidatus Solibacter sp.]